MRAVLSLVALAAMASAGPADAHHSFAAWYFEEQSMSIEGTLAEFDYRNPHSFVHVDAPDKNNLMRRWSAEWRGAAQLQRNGVEQDTLKPGDVVRLTGSPGRNPDEYRLHLRSIVRLTDGWEYPKR